MKMKIVILAPVFILEVLAAEVTIEHPTCQIINQTFGRPTHHYHLERELEKKGYSFIPERKASFGLLLDIGVKNNGNCEFSLLMKNPTHPTKVVTRTKKFLSLEAEVEEKDIKAGKALVELEGHLPKTNCEDKLKEITKTIPPCKIQKPVTLELRSEIKRIEHENCGIFFKTNSHYEKKIRNEIVNKGYKIGDKFSPEEGTLLLHFEAEDLKTLSQKNFCRIKMSMEASHSMFTLVQKEQGERREIPDGVSLNLSEIETRPSAYASGSQHCEEIIEKVMKSIPQCRLVSDTHLAIHDGETQKVKEVGTFKGSEKEFSRARGE